GVDAALRRGRTGEVYNFGGRSERQNLDVTRTVLHLTERPLSLIRHVGDRPGHDRRYAVDCSKAEVELGWRATVPFEAGLAATVAWYRANAGWVERVRSGAYRTGPEPSPELPPPAAGSRAAVQQGAHALLGE
ncbi:MAG: GDP-mannose 4,6-dehydratase, partial [Isosphaeraceae bacterium]|nr:GDP-mannose 4,6-dehydratase [Isosphaeraceae bacterium]